MGWKNINGKKTKHLYHVNGEHDSFLAVLFMCTPSILTETHHDICLPTSQWQISSSIVPLNGNLVFHAYSQTLGQT